MSVHAKARTETQSVKKDYIQTLFYLSRPLRKYPGEVLAMRIEDNQPQDRHDDCQRYTCWI